MNETKQNPLKPSVDSDLLSLNGSGQFIYPRYQGESILNILPSIANSFGLPDFQHTLLKQDLLSPLQGEPQNIILVLLDALAYHRLENWLSEDEDLGWHQLRDQGVFAPLTSICPSTTCAAITSYWTDSAAYEHGVMGYEMWLKEYGITANMIEHKPITYRSRGGGLDLAGFDPENFLPVNSIVDRFLDHDVEAHAFQHFAIINSGLSQMFMGGAERHPIATSADLWISIRELLEAKPRTRKYIWSYWGQLDGTSHLHGPDSERARAEFISFSKAFQDQFLEKLDPDLKQNTMVILTADHGQITTDPTADKYDFDAADELLTVWAERKGDVQAVKEVNDKDRKQQRKAATTGGKGSGEPISRKIYRRSDIVNLMMNDPDRYKANVEEFDRAYAEGRVK